MITKIENYFSLVCENALRWWRFVILHAHTCCTCKNGGDFPHHLTPWRCRVLDLPVPATSTVEGATISGNKTVPSRPAWQTPRAFLLTTGRSKLSRRGGGGGVGPKRELGKETKIEMSGWHPKKPLYRNWRQARWSSTFVCDTDGWRNLRKKFCDRKACVSYRSAIFISLSPILPSSYYPSFSSSATTILPTTPSPLMKSIAGRGNRFGACGREPKNVRGCPTCSLFQTIFTWLVTVCPGSFAHISMAHLSFFPLLSTYISLIQVPLKCLCQVPLSLPSTLLLWEQTFFFLTCNRRILATQEPTKPSLLSKIGANGVDVILQLTLC